MQRERSQAGATTRQRWVAERRTSRRHGDVARCLLLRHWGAGAIEGLEAGVFGVLCRAFRGVNVWGDVRVVAGVPARNDLWVLPRLLRCGGHDAPRVRSSVWIHAAREGPRRSFSVRGSPGRWLTPRGVLSDIRPRGALSDIAGATPGPLGARIRPTGHGLSEFQDSPADEMEDGRSAPFTGVHLVSHLASRRRSRPRIRHARFSVAARDPGSDSSQQRPLSRSHV